jgi:hypothetical protein
LKAKWLYLRRTNKDIGVEPPPVTREVITLEGDQFCIYFPYDAQMVQNVKTAFSYRRYQKGSNGPATNHWEVPARFEAVEEMAKFVQTHGFDVTEGAKNVLDSLAQQAQVNLVPTPNITAEILEQEVVGFTINTKGVINQELNSVIKSGGNYRFDGEHKVWHLSFSKPAVKAIETLITQYGMTTEEGLVYRVNAQLAEIKKVIELSGLADTDIEIACNQGMSYLGFQKAGIVYARRGNTLIGDEPGLGKTIQGVGVSNDTPSISKVLILCPASLKLNWKREWLKWDIKGLSVGVIMDGKSEFPNTDVVILNYNAKLLKNYIAAIHARTWDLIIIDEVHNLRNPKAQWTKMVFGYTPRNSKETAVPAIQAGKKLYLTGTPITNRPIELWPLLSSLRPDIFNNFVKFAFRYCGAENDGHGWNFKGASNLDELQELLRSTCMIRRLKTQVLKELPKKTRQIIELEDVKGLAKKEQSIVNAAATKMAEIKAKQTLAYLSNDVAAYKLAAKELKDLQNTSFDQMSKVRHATALAKVPQVIQLIEELLEAA